MYLHIYCFTPAASVFVHQVAAGKKVAEKVTTEGIEVALNPEELDLDTAAMQAKYEQTVLEQQSQLEKEDLSDMLAEHAAKQKVIILSGAHKTTEAMCGKKISVRAFIWRHILVQKHGLDKICKLL